MPNALFITDERGIIKTSNHASSNLTGYDEHELSGKSIQSLIIIRKKKGSKINKQDITNYLMINRELNCRSKSGEKIPSLISSSYCTNETGDTLGIIFVMQDLTERKKMEANIL